MQQFTVPQFISIESQIIGPITVRQFIIMMAGFVIMGICYKIFSFWAFLTISVIIFGITGVFAFLKINGQAFHFYVLNLSQFLKRPRLKIWYHELEIVKEKEKVKKESAVALPPRVKKPIGRTRLSELSLVVDTGGTYRTEK
jgi:hypothetical protein